jgi:hypothetical protein
MRLPVCLIAISLCLGACKDKGGAPLATADSTPVAAPAEKPSTQAPPNKAATWPKVTPEEASSTVIVKVVAGGIPPKSYPGAILHRDEVKDIPILQDTKRCVLAVLSGWNEDQLRNRGCRIYINRNRTDNAGNMESAGHMAQLLQFDQETGLAALRYVENFDATLEAGYHLERSPQPPGGTLAIRALAGDAAYGAPTANVQHGPPLVFQAGTFSPMEGNGGKIEFPPGQNGTESEEGPSLFAVNDKLVGFLSSPAPGKLVRTDHLKLDFPVPSFNPVGIAFGTKVSGSLPIVITTENSGPKLSGQLRLRFLDSGEAKATDSPSPGRPSQPGSAFKIDPRTLVYLTSNDSVKWRGQLKLPDETGSEISYRLQLGWSPFPTDVEPSLFSRIFTVKLKVDAQSNNVVAETEGIDNLNNVPQPAQGVATSFALEAKIRDFYEIAGGREVLFRLDGPPYWKRFSMTRKEWLPLPPVNLTNAWVAGNLNALFILDRSTSDVRKFGLADLRPLGAVKLPANEYVASLAGADSEHGPVQVLSKEGSLALSADNLQRRDFTFAVDRIMHQSLERYGPQDEFQISGDSLTTFQYRNTITGHLHYASDALGAQRDYISTKIGGVDRCGVPVSAAYALDPDHWLSTVATPDGNRVISTEPPGPQRRCAHWLCPVGPVIFRKTPSDPNAIPPQASAIQCYSYFDSSPFAEIPAPELEEPRMGTGMQAESRWIAFDPYSLRLGVVSIDRKNWVIHQIPTSTNRSQPVLLNWPDPILQRGTEWRFKPMLFGGTDFTAELLGAKESSVKVENGEIIASVAPQELASLQLLNIKVPGKGGILTYGVPLHILGPQLPIVAPPGETNLATVGASFESLASPKDSVKTLRSTVVGSAEPVRDVLGPAANHLIFVTDTQHVEFFSLASRSIVKVLAAPAKATYFAGAEALFDYDGNARTLTRISVPDGRHENTMTLPKGLRLHALGVGRAATSPLTLLLEQIQGETSGQLGDYTLTLTYFDRDAVVVDSHTLAASGWAQPKLWLDKNKFAVNGNPYNFGALAAAPRPLATSHSGQFVTLPQVFLALGRQSFAVPFPPGGNPTTLDMGSFPPTGSISGSIAANSMGTVFNGGISDNYMPIGSVNTSVTPCGRYRLISHPPGAGSSSETVSVQTVENKQALLELGRLDFNRQLFNPSNMQAPRRIFVAGDSGPLIVQAGGGRVIQIVDFDIPALAREMSPKTFHVTSQAPPLVLTGGAFDYQIEVNNPEVVTSYRLHNETPGATITPQGKFHYNAPQVTEPTRVSFSVEILGKDGQSVMHEFPVFVLPPAPPTQQPSATPFVPRKSV